MASSIKNFFYKMYNYNTQEEEKKLFYEVNMTYEFKLPEIEDQQDLTKIPSKKEMDSDKDKQTLKEFNDQRVQFKEKTSIEFIQKNSNLFNFQNIYDKYMQSTILMLELLQNTKDNKFEFKYKTFLNPQNPNYSTKNDNHLEAFGIEIYFTRIIHAMDFLAASVRSFQTAQNVILQTVGQQKSKENLDSIVAGTDLALRQLLYGYKSLQYLQQNFSFLNNIMKKSVQDYRKCIELSPEFLSIIKLIYETYGNYLQLENFMATSHLTQNNFLYICSLCKTSQFDIEQILQIISETGKDPNQVLNLQQQLPVDLAQYFQQLSEFFFKGMQIWSMMKNYESLFLQTKAEDPQRCVYGQAAYKLSENIRISLGASLSFKVNMKEGTEQVQKLNQNIYQYYTKLFQPDAAQVANNFQLFQLQSQIIKDPYSLTSSVVPETNHLEKMLKNALQY